MHACNPSTRVGGRGSEVQGNLQLHEEFKASLGYMRPCLQKRRRRERRNRGRKRRIPRKEARRAGGAVLTQSFTSLAFGGAMVKRSIIV